MSGAENGSENSPVFGPQVPRPLRIRILQAASLVLATGGLILLYLFSVHRDIPSIAIREIQPTMSFATVRLSGKVTSDAFLFKSGGLVFNVNDGTGELGVLGNRAQADAMTAAGRLPRRGDQVELVGSLSMGADQVMKLRLVSIERHVTDREALSETDRADTPMIRLSDLGAVEVNARVAVVGLLKKIDVPGPGSNAPYVLTLEEDGIQRPVVFWNDVFLGMNQTLPLPGERIRACGRVEVYCGMVQLKLRDALDLSVLPDTEN